ncbi:Alpha/Beta hydrolase protein [Rhizoctonia solani]|nr:Alpha/Beta hydrolase protein [Rhizoctonia solani]
MPPYDEIRPFTISVPEEELDQLRKKLELTRLPDELELPAGQEWEWGIPLTILKPVVDYWRTQYDWRAIEAHINQTLPQFTAYVDSAKHGQQEVHFVHKRSHNSNAVPLIFLHGWPGNFLEASLYIAVSKIIEELVNPKDPNNPSFHIVAPSLPGYVFSQPANTPGMNVVGTAYLFDKLMAKLGYKYYVAQGGDWGAIVARALAVYHQDTCLATHSNFNVIHFPSPFKNPIMILKAVLGFAGLPGGYPKDEIDAIKLKKEFLATGAGYQKIQGTRPQTLAVGLTDSPVGLLAWIGEKLHEWADSYPWTPEEWITWTMLYWIKGPAGGLRYYKENSITAPPKDPELRAEFNKLIYLWSPTPHGFSWFPKDGAFPEDGIRANLVYSQKHTKGGHFAAWEVPDEFASDIQNFVAIVLEKEVRLLGVQCYNSNAGYTTPPFNNTEEWFY